MGVGLNGTASFLSNCGALRQSYKNVKRYTYSRFEGVEHRDANFVRGCPSVMIRFCRRYVFIPCWLDSRIPLLVYVDPRLQLLAFFPDSDRLCRSKTSRFDL